MDLLDYPVRICVAGSRSWHIPYLFDIFLRDFLSRVDIGQYAFISGVAWRGADKLIIDWCEENDEICFPYPANWKKYGKGAGYRRNAEMRSVLTHLLVFWDGKSSGTLEMIKKTDGMDNVHVSVILVEPDEEWIEYCRQQEASKRYF